MNVGYCRDQAAALAEETTARAAPAAATTARVVLVATSSTATPEALTTTEACQSLRCHCAPARVNWKHLMTTAPWAAVVPTPTTSIAATP